MPGQMPYGGPMGNPYLNPQMGFQPGFQPGGYPANTRPMGMPAAGYPMQGFAQPGMQMMRPAMPQTPYGQMQPAMGMPLGAGGVMQPQPGAPAPAPQGQG